MNSSNVRRLAAFGVIAAGLLGAMSLAGASQAKSNLYYQYYFYSDASHTVMVGHYRQQCLNNDTIITPLVTGQTSPFYTREAIGNCPGLGDW